MEVAELLWEPPTEIEKGWISEEEGKIRCMYCDYVMVWDLPVEQKLVYSWFDGSHTDLIGHFVEVPPDEKYYERRYVLNKIKETHWSTSHLLPDNWEEKWEDNGEMIHCCMCGYRIWYDTRMTGESKLVGIEDRKKYHRRVCDPKRITYG